MKLTKIFATLAVVALFAACCPCRKQASAKAEPLVGTNWQLVQFEGRTFEANDNYTLLFSADDKLSGQGDCNRLMGNYTLSEGDQMKIGMLASTRAMCPNQEMEDKFIAMLQTIDSYKIDGKLLMLFDNSELKMVFEKK